MTMREATIPNAIAICRPRAPVGAGGAGGPAVIGGSRSVMLAARCTLFADMRSRFHRPRVYCSDDGIGAFASGGESVPRKGKCDLGFHVHVGPAGQIDGDLGDGAAG